MPQCRDVKPLLDVEVRRILDMTLCDDHRVTWNRPVIVENDPRMRVFEDDGAGGWWAGPEGAEHSPLVRPSQDTRCHPGPAKRREGPPQRERFYSICRGSFAAVRRLRMTDLFLDDWTTGRLAVPY